MRVALDVDTGVDDALALIFAIRHPDLDVRAVTCVTGNVPVDQVVLNTLTVLDAIGARDVLVARGAERPLLAPPPEGDSVHGRDGLADLGLPRPRRQPVAMPAVDLLAQVIAEASEPITLVGLAPLTNLALLARSHPGAMRRVERVVLVGARFQQRHGAPDRRDFNLTADPEAAAIVLGSGVPILIYSLDVFHEVRLTRASAERLAAADASAVALAGRLALHQVRRAGGEHGTIGDAGAVISLVLAGSLAAVERRISVRTQGELRGQLLLHSGRSGDASEGTRTGQSESGRADPVGAERAPADGVGSEGRPVQIVTTVDSTAYADAFLETVTRLS